jgi:hypothetical protein
VFEVYSAAPPVDVPFQATRLSLRIVRLPIHRFRAEAWTGKACDRLPAPRGARLARRDCCGFNRRAFAPHLQREVIPRPPLPAPPRI